MANTKTYAVAAGAALVAGLATSWLWTVRGGEGCATTATAGMAQLGGPMTLVDERGANLSQDEIFARPALMYFGFASCPDVCPPDNARNADVAYILAAEGVDLRPVFVSVDPGRDTPDRLADYTDAFHPDMLGLSGTADQVAEAASAWAVSYRIGQPAPPEAAVAGAAAGPAVRAASGHMGEHADHDMGYDVSHTTFTYLVRAGGEFADVFPRNLAAEEVAARASCLLDGAA